MTHVRAGGHPAKPVGGDNKMIRSELITKIAEENPHLPAGPRELLHRYVDAGKLGVKTGEGFYRHR